jgi:putative membrane protein
MTVLEPARSRKPVTWLTVLGVLLLPAVIGGVLVAALYNPTERLENMSAAIVNLDDPVTIDGQYTPLGRQLAAGLVDGSDDLDSNLDWVLSSEDDASEGLRDGTYQAVVTIPEEFSAAATSSGQALSGTQDAAEQATIEVTTAPDALVVDEAITAQVADVAASTMGDMLSEATLSNLLIGFTTMGDQLGDAADGARQLAGGAGEARTGADQLADGATQAADGVAQLGDGVSQLATGAGASADGAHQLAGGAAALAQGLRGDGTGTGIADGAQQLAGGAQQLADGISAVNVGLNGDGSAANPGLAAGAAGVAQGVNGLNLGLNGDGTAANPGLAGGLEGLAAMCRVSAAPAFCDELDKTVASAQTLAGYAADTAPGAQRVSDGLAQVAGGTPQLAAGAQTLATGASGLAAGAAQSADGADQLAAGASELGSGLDQLTSGAEQAAAGVPQLHDGVSQLATGAGDLGDGIGELAGGASELAGGLEQAVDAVPSYDDREAQDLASVVANPVGTSGTGDSLFGASAIPLLATAVLWFGGLATFLALRAVSARALTSRRASVLLAGGALLPAAVIGALQGALVAGILQLAGGYEIGTFWGLLGVSVLAGVAFAAVHQALVAVFGGAGRWIAAIVGAVAIAVSIVSTIPSELLGVKAFLPTTPAFDAFLAVMADTGAGGAAIAGLLIWAVLSFAVSTLAVARRRSVSAKALLEPAFA